MLSIPCEPSLSTANDLIAHFRHLARALHTAAANLSRARDPGARRLLEAQRSSLEDALLQMLTSRPQDLAGEIASAAISLSKQVLRTFPEGRTPSSSKVADGTQHWLFLTGMDDEWIRLCFCKDVPLEHAAAEVYAWADTHERRNLVVALLEDRPVLDRIPEMFTTLDGGHLFAPYGRELYLELLRSQMRLHPRQFDDPMRVDLGYGNRFWILLWVMAGYVPSDDFAATVRISSSSEYYLPLVTCADGRSRLIAEHGPLESWFDRYMKELQDEDDHSPHG